MAPKQVDLVLQGSKADGGVGVGEGSKAPENANRAVPLASSARAVDSLSRAIKEAMKSKDTSDIDRVVTLRKALKFARELPLSDLIAEVERTITQAEERIAAGLNERREQLLKAARDAAIPHKRFTEFDQVGVFKVTYKGKRVRLHLGSELAVEFDETDGRRVLDRIQAEKSALDRVPFSREEFFRMVKTALQLARAEGHQGDGGVPIRLLYPFLVLARQARSKEFLDAPKSRQFTEYPMVQFVYDLARFGRGGWALGTESLRTTGPNMATIQQGKAVMLPLLDSLDGTPTQLAVLRLERKEA